METLLKYSHMILQPLRACRPGQWCSCYYPIKPYDYGQSNKLRCNIVKLKNKSSKIHRMILINDKKEKEIKKRMQIRYYIHLYHP